MQNNIGSRVSSYAIYKQDPALGFHIYICYLYMIKEAKDKDFGWTKRRKTLSCAEAVENEQRRSAMTSNICATLIALRSIDRVLQRK